MRTGIVKIFKGTFGIIEPHGAKKDDPDVFFHRSVMRDVLSFTEGQWVQFETIPGYLSKHGTEKAVWVELCKKRGEHERSMDRERSKVVSIGTD